MIYAQLLDAGTSPIVNPAIFGPFPPGMDGLVYREIDFEEDGVAPRPHEINEDLRAVEPVEMRPWPEKMLGQSWIDRTPRYEIDGETEGFRLNLHRFDRLTKSSSLVPAGEIKIDPDATNAETDRQDARLVRELLWKEVQDRSSEPAKWLRLDVENRRSTGTDLEDPLVANWRGLRGNEFRLEMPDQSLFVPFDFRHPERYKALTDDGEQINDPELVEHAVTLHAGGTYRLYFRPRKWRYVATVIVHYAYISAFEYFIAQETFTRAHTDRPPFYPVRHDIIHTSKNPSIPNYFGVLQSYDPGINSQWEMSRSAASLAREIIEGQYFTKLVAKIFAGNEPPTVVVTRREPDPGDIVLGIGRVDRMTGRETRTWIVQRTSVFEIYPWTVLGSFMIPWYVTGVPI